MYQVLELKIIEVSKFINLKLCVSQWPMTMIYKLMSFKHL